MKIEIFPSFRAQEEARAWNFSMSQGPYKGGEFGVFPSPKDYMKAVLRIFPSPKTHIDMGVPNPIYWHISSYSFIFSTYSYIFLHIFVIFLHIFNIFLHIFGLFRLILTYSFILSTYGFIYSTYSFIFRSYLLHQGIPECDVIERGGVLANPEITP